MRRVRSLAGRDPSTSTVSLAPRRHDHVNLYDPSDATCADTPAYTQTVDLSGNGTYSTTNTTFYATDEGTSRWQVDYSGDGNNDSATSAGGVENFTISNG